MTSTSFHYAARDGTDTYFEVPSEVAADMAADLALAHKVRAAESARRAVAAELWRPPARCPAGG